MPGRLRGGLCPYLPHAVPALFLHDPVPQEHKDGIDIGRDLLRRSRVLVVCGHIVTEEMKNDIAIAQRLGITATTLEGILTVKGQGKHRRTYFSRRMSPTWASTTRASW